MNLGIILILAISASPAPSASPAASPAADPCGSGGATALLSALNRPTIGFSPCAVKPGESVFELGYANQAGGAAQTTYPQGNLRFGVAPGLELDVLGPNYEIARGLSTQRGFLDSGIGAKWEAAHDARSALGFDFLYTVPSGAAAFTAGSPTATVNFDYSRSLSQRIGFGTTIGVQSTAAASLAGNVHRFASLVPSVVLTDQFNPRAQLYAEAYGQTKIRPDGGTLFGLDGGLQYLLTPAIEIDVEAGRTSTDLVQAHYVGAGIGVRF
jgi:hypothetical protein